MAFFDELKQRKIVQWALAYAAGAWATLQLLDILSSTYSLSPFVMRAAPIVLATGLLIVVVLAWYHGEKGMQRITAAELTIVTVLLIVAGAAVTLVARPNQQGNAVDADEVQNASVAVMPFTNMSSDKEQDYFSDGITEEILNALAQIEGLHVAARTSSFAFKNKEATADSIGRQLRVAHILEGSVRKSGNHLRISAQLINARTGYHLWSENFDHEEEDILAVQDKIARKVADVLRVKLTHADAAASPPVKINPEAHNEYLRGLALWNVRSATSLKEALEHFKRAATLDPSYALAYAMIAQTYAVLPSWSHGVRGADVVDSARAAAQKAFALDPDLPEAHAALGSVAAFYDYQWLEADKHFERALELNPSYATAHQWLAESLAARDPARAVHEARRAAALDPLSKVVNLQVANALIASRDLEAAIGVVHGIRALDPKWPSTYSAPIMINALMGNTQRLKTELANVKAAGVQLDAEYEILARAVIDPTQRTAALAAFKKNKDRPTSSARWLSILGDRSALDVMEQAIDAMHPDAPRHLAGPWFDWLNEDPRYVALLKRVNLKPFNLNPTR